MLDAVLDAVYPRRCAGCGDGPWPFCRRCLARVLPLEPPWCRRCGSPSGGDRPSCPDCPPAPIALARSAFRLEGPIRRAVHRLKFAGWRPVARALGQAMTRSWLEHTPQERPDMVTWVPLSRRREAERGFDQARALALAVASDLGVRARPLLVRPDGDRATQARRDRAARLAAMRGRFVARAPALGTVMLVDDVLTTGATASSCAEALVRAGAERVVVLTAARSLTPIQAGAGGADILRDGPASGSVVARGRGSPVVDASRGRNDPRKATLGR